MKTRKLIEWFEKQVEHVEFDTQVDLSREKNEIIQRLREYDELREEVEKLLNEVMDIIEVFYGVIRKK